MDDYSKQKISQFVRDKAMFDAVGRVINDTFLQKREGDVYTKAAQRLAIDFHLESWETLRKIYNTTSNEPKEKTQTAL